MDGPDFVSVDERGTGDVWAVRFGDGFGAGRLHWSLLSAMDGVGGVWVVVDGQCGEYCG